MTPLASRSVDLNADDVPRDAVRKITDGMDPMVTGASGPPFQGRSTTEVLASFDSDFEEVAHGVTRGEYLLWLGSGLSRSVVPNVQKLLVKLLCFMQEQIDTSDEDCRFTRAVNDILRCGVHSCRSPGCSRPFGASRGMAPGRPDSATSPPLLGRSRRKGCRRGERLPSFGTASTSA